VVRFLLIPPMLSRYRVIRILTRLLPSGFRFFGSLLPARTAWSKQGRTDGIRTLHHHSPRPRVRVIGRQLARPHKRVAGGRLTGSDREARQGGAAPVIDRIFKVNGSPRAVGSQVEQCRIGDGEGRSAAHAIDAGGVDRHRNTGHLEWCW
jgi:hypothetical protein